MQPISRLIIASSITSFLGNQDFLQTYMWQKNFSWINNRPIVKKTIDLLFSKKNWKEEISATLPHQWETLGPMPSKVGVLNVLQFIMTWYMNLFPLLLSAVCLEAWSWTVALKYPEESLIGHCKDNITQGFLLVPLLWYQKCVIDKSLILT